MLGDTTNASTVPTTHSSCGLKIDLNIFTRLRGLTATTSLLHALTNNISPCRIVSLCARPRVAALISCCVRCCRPRLTNRSGHRCIDADLRLAQVAAVRCPGDVVLAFVLLVRQAHAAVRLLTGRQRRRSDEARKHAVIISGVAVRLFVVRLADDRIIRCFVRRVVAVSSHLRTVPHRGGSPPAAERCWTWTVCRRPADFDDSC